MGKWLLFACCVIVISVFIAVFIGHKRESAKVKQLVETLIQSVPRPVTGTVDFGTFSELPPPVARYFKHVLTEGQYLIRTATIQQSGMLRTSAMSEHWSPFTARQLVVPPAKGFVWKAKVDMPLATHVRVLDTYCIGVGSGRVSFLSALAVASEAGAPELNSGALHRYLAEAVWYPTALLPQSGLEWTRIDERSAMATLTNSGITVSLEFRFNDLGEVTSIYSPGRFGRFHGGYKRVPWEGHFRDYQEQAGMRVPLYGEVGWIVDGSLQLVWKGGLDEVRYEFGP